MNILERLKYTIELALGSVECIVEHADPRGVIINQIRDIVPNIVTHLYKIYGFGNTNEQTIHHWLAEISANIRSFCYTRIKHTNKPLSTKEIMNVFKDKYRDASELAQVESFLYPEYGYSDIDNETLYNKIYNVLPVIIDYIKSIPANERPQINKLQQLIL